MVTGMAFVNPIKALANIDLPFKKFKGADLTVPKAAFVACNLGERPASTGAPFSFS